MAGSLWRNSEGDWGSVEVGPEGGGGTEPLLLQLSLLAVLGRRGGDICRRGGRWNHSCNLHTSNRLSEADKSLKLFASVLIPFK